MSVSPFAAVPLTFLDIAASSGFVSVICTTLESGLEVVVPSVLGSCSVGGSEATSAVAARVGVAVSGCCVEFAPLSEATLAKATEPASASYGRL